MAADAWMAEYCLNLMKTDMIATEAHGKTRKNK